MLVLLVHVSAMGAIEIPRESHAPHLAPSDHANIIAHIFIDAVLAVLAVHHLRNVGGGLFQHNINVDPGRTSARLFSSYPRLFKIAVLSMYSFIPVSSMYCMGHDIACRLLF
jgi:hypothetical protein